MKRSVFLLMLSLIFTVLQAQDIEVYNDYKDFKSNLIKESSKLYVVNYWATWCAPCIKELPYFENLKSEYGNKDVEVVLVSIDFKNQYESKLLPFVKNKNLQSRVIHMADPNSNIWIDLVDKSWSGAIPATQFIMGEEKLFLEKAFEDYTDLKNELDKFLESIQ